MAIDLSYIQNLALNHEGVDVEFKESTGQLDRGMETLCGMLNGTGGIVVFGIKNSGKIVGQEIGDKTLPPCVSAVPTHLHTWTGEGLLLSELPFTMTV